MMLAGLLYFYLKGRRNLPPQCSEEIRVLTGPEKGKMSERVPGY